MTDQATPFTDDKEAAPVEAAAQPQAPAADPQPVATPAPVFTIPETAQDLVGEGKKYSTVEAALSALAPSQSHIATLEAEAEEMRQELARRQTAAELVEQINKTPSGEQTAPQFDPSQLDALIEQKLSSKEQAKVAEQNTKSVVSKMTEVFGDKAKAEEMYVGKAKELGLSVEYMNTLAATSPKAVLELYGIKDKTQVAPAKIHSDVNTEAVHNAPAPEKPLRSVMGGASTREAVNAWKAVAEQE